MRLIQETNVQAKTILLRCDFNMPLRDGVVFDNFRLLSHLETIQYLRKQNSRVVLLSHFEADGKNPSLKPLIPVLSGILKTKVRFLPWPLKKRTKKIIMSKEEGAVFLLENLRKDKGEKGCAKEFARRLAGLADIFVQDAFSVCHRKHASIVLLPKLLPSFAGFSLQKEIASLGLVLRAPKRPFTAIIGGSKVDEKMKPLLSLLKLADNVILGGKLVSQILSVRGIIIGKLWPKEETVKLIQKIPRQTNLYLPLDVLVSSDPSGKNYLRTAAPGRVLQNEEIYDIGEEAIKTFSKIISFSKTILWVGAMGKVEAELFSKGTREIAEAIAQNRTAFKLAGGGDTVSVIRQMGLENNFSYLSTGGGALLDYIAFGSLPGLDALRQRF